MSLILLHQPQFPHSLTASCMYTGKKKKKEIISAVIRYWFQWVQPCVQDSFFIFCPIQQLSGLEVCEWRIKGMQPLGVE